MGNQKLNVRLSGPAKVAGKWRKAGETVDVDQRGVDDLRAAGVLEGDSVPAAAESEVGPALFDQAVQSKAKEIAEAIVEAAVDQAVTELTLARDEANARAAEAEAQRDLLQDRVLELQAQIEAVETNTSREQAGGQPKATATNGAKRPKPAPKG
ncbi:MAG: hypothetical protein AB7S99_15685 [Pseudodonghicola sp.]